MGMNIADSSILSDGQSATDADGVRKDATCSTPKFRQIPANTVTCPQTAVEMFDTELH